MDLLSYKAIAACLCLTPVVHSASVLWHGLPRKAVSSWRLGCTMLLRFPLTGGARHSVCQCMGWALWTLSVLACMHLSAHAEDAGQLQPHTHTPAVGATAVSSLTSLLFIVQAMLVYEHLGPPSPRISLDGATTTKGAHTPRRPRLSSGSGTAGSWRPRILTKLRQQLSTSQSGQLLCRHGPAAAVLCMGLLLSTTGVLLLLSVEHMPDTPSRLLYCCLSLVCLIIGASSTHGLGGYLQWGRQKRHSNWQPYAATAHASSKPHSTVSSSSSEGNVQAAGHSKQEEHKQADKQQQQQQQQPDKLADTVDDDGSNWAFFQPFAGGTAFVATQAVAWSLFAVSCVLVVAVCKVVLGGMLSCLRHWLLGTSVLMLTTQLVLAVSVFTWRSSKRGGVQAVSSRAVHSMVGSARAAWHQLLCIHVPIVIMYMPAQAFFGLWALSFALCPTRWAVLGWLLIVPLGYLVSIMVGEPQHTGSRTWPAFIEWFSRHIEPSLMWWAGSVRVIADWDEKDGPPPAHHKYIFGFHPHGFYPTGAGLLPLMPSFQRLVPGIRPVTLTASLMYRLPVCKDFALWLGFRQVERRTFVRALNECGSVILCPGGQSELLYAHASHFPTPTIQPLLAQMAAQPQAGAQKCSTAHTTPESVMTHVSGSSNGVVTPAGISFTVRPRAAPVLDIADKTAVASVHTSPTGTNANTGRASQAVATDVAPTGNLSNGATAKHSAAKGMVPAGEFVVYDGHKGFVRLAIEQQASLVPVLALGEVLQLRNFANMGHRMQRWTYKHVNLPLPWLSVGHASISHLPLRTPLVYVIGKPIAPPPYSGSGSVPQADVDALHAAFYESLADMFRRHAPDHPAFQNAAFTLLHTHVPPLRDAKLAF